MWVSDYHFLRWIKEKSKFCWPYHAIFNICFRGCFLGQLHPFTNIDGLTPFSKSSVPLWKSNSWYFLISIHLSAPMKQRTPWDFLRISPNISYYHEWKLLLILLYRGAFSIVKRCVHKESRMEYAAKIFNTRKLTARGKFQKEICLSLSLALS